MPAAGGGVHGKAAGTAPVTMTEAGRITEACHLFIEIFPPVGEIITEIVSGKGKHGNINAYINRIFNAIGVAGNKTGIGKGKTPGVFRDYKNGIPEEV